MAENDVDDIIYRIRRLLEERLDGLCDNRNSFGAEWLLCRFEAVAGVHIFSVCSMPYGFLDPRYSLIELADVFSS